MKHKFSPLFFYFLFIFIINSCSVYQKPINSIDYRYNVEIHRDVYGVPHIYGKTDEDAAFGLAYAHAEDDYETIQDILLITRGQSASVYGAKNAPFDYLVGFLDVWQTVDNNYQTLSPKVISICNSYADGINNFIEKNPSKLKGDLYPVTGKDIIAGFAFRTPLMFNLHFYIEKISQEGDDEINTLIRNKLKKYQDKGKKKKFSIANISNIQKSSQSKNKSGNTDQYLLSVEVEFLIKSESGEEKFIALEKFKMKNFENEFDEKRYETTIKNNLTELIVKNLIIQLSRMQ